MRTPLDVSAVASVAAKATRRPSPVAVRGAEPQSSPPAAGSIDVGPATATTRIEERPPPFRIRVRDRAGRAELLVFRVGRERFALELCTVEEAVESPALRPVPDAPRGMVGVFPLRGRLLPTFAPELALGVDRASDTPSVLVVRTDAGRFALAVDEVDDVFETSLAAAREAPGTDDADGVLLAVLWRDRDLIGILDGDALRAACLATPSAASA